MRQNVHFDRVERSNDVNSKMKKEEEEVYETIPTSETPKKKKGKKKIYNLINIP